MIMHNGAALISILNKHANTAEHKFKLRRGDFNKNDPRQTITVAIPPIAAAAVALALVSASLGSRPVHHHPAPAAVAPGVRVQVARV